jgi:hypothetical protein
MTCLTSLPTQHYVSMLQVLFFRVFYCASQINKIVSLVNQKMSLQISLQDNSHFQNVTKMPLHCLYMDTLQDALKNASTVLVTLFLRHIPKFHKNMTL